MIATYVAAVVVHFRIDCCHHRNAGVVVKVQIFLCIFHMVYI